MNILVTGGLGYIGSHTVVELLHDGHDIVIIDNLSNSCEKTLENIGRACGLSRYKDLLSFYRVDLRDEPHLNRVFREFNFDCVVHFAACKSVGESMTDPDKYYDTNVRGTYNLLSALNTHGVKNLIFSSSCTVYGQADELPITEQTPIKPAESVYGRTKQICEQMITDMHLGYDYNSTLLRYFNPIGAHESACIGERPNGIPDNLMPYVTQAAAGIREKITVHGTDYDTPDGTAIRDYIHVVDLAKAHAKAVNVCTGDQKFRAEPINLGTGNGYSVKQVLDAFEKHNNIKLNVEFGPRRAGDITAAWADASHAEQVLDWRAELGLQQMVTSAWKWELQNNTR